MGFRRQAAPQFGLHFLHFSGEQRGHVQMQAWEDEAADDAFGIGLQADVLPFLQLKPVQIVVLPAPDDIFLRPVAAINVQFSRNSSPGL
jgi:hypothetical protein